MGDMEPDRTEGSSRRSGNSPVFSFEDFCSYVDKLGFHASSPDAARELFETVGFQRLLPYLSFIDENRISYAGRSMEALSELIEFDSAVRCLVLKYVDIIETQLKARYAQFMLEELGEFCIMDKRNFKYEAEYQEAIRAIRHELIRQKKDNAAVQRQLEHGFERVPVRLALEVSSLGAVSKLLRNTKSPVVTSKVAASFGVNKRCLLSWVETISLVRNACAHFAPYAVRRQIPSAPKPVFGVEGNHAEPLYVFAVIERLLLGRVEAGYEKASRDFGAFRAEVDEILGRFAVRNPELAGALRIPPHYVARYCAGSRIALCHSTHEPAVHYEFIPLAA